MITGLNKNLFHLIWNIILKGKGIKYSYNSFNLSYVQTEGKRIFYLMFTVYSLILFRLLFDLFCFRLV